MGMTRKQLADSLKGNPNKDFILDQVDAQLGEDDGPPYLFWFPSFRVKSGNTTEGRKWAATNRRVAAERAYNEAGVITVKKTGDRRFIHLIRIIQPGGQFMDSKTENMRVGFKSIVDELTKRGYIHDDSDDWIETKYSQRRMIKDVENVWGVRVGVYAMNADNEPMAKDGSVVIFDDWRFKNKGGEDGEC